MDADNIIIGGGPCGAITAAALAAQGKAALVIDVGLSLEPARRAAIMRLSNSLPESWTTSDVNMIQHQPATGEGLGRKLWFGSDVVYSTPSNLVVDTEGVGATLSFAGGGLSNVWGATMLPYAERDLRGCRECFTSAFMR